MGCVMLKVIGDAIHRGIGRAGKAEENPQGPLESQPYRLKNYAGLQNGLPIIMNG